MTTPTLAKSQVDMEKVFPDACRQFKESVIGLQGIAVQAHEVAFQEIKGRRGNPETDSFLKALNITAEIAGSLCNSLNRFTANRIMKHDGSGFKLSKEDFSRIFEAKKLVAWIDSIEDRTFSDLWRVSKDCLDNIHRLVDNKTAWNSTEELANRMRDLRNEIADLSSYLVGFVAARKAQH